MKIWFEEIIQLHPKYTLKPILAKYCAFYYSNKVCDQTLCIFLLEKVLSKIKKNIWYYQAYRSKYTLKPILSQNMVHSSSIKKNQRPHFRFGTMTSSGSTELKFSSPFRFIPQIPTEILPSSN